MQIHVARQQQQLGVFDFEDIVVGLSDGRFHANDLACREGMAAWTPLGDWAEFRVAGVPSSPGTVADAPVASLIPWEQGKSLGSFFATIKMAIVSPSSFATGRYAFADWRAFCYVGILISLPFQLTNVIAFEDKNAQVGEFLRSLNIPVLLKSAQQIGIAHF